MLCLHTESHRLSQAGLQSNQRDYAPNCTTTAKFGLFTCKNAILATSTILEAIFVGHLGHLQYNNNLESTFLATLPNQDGQDGQGGQHGN
jgi:hypothetical protein